MKRLIAFVVAVTLALCQAVHAATFVAAAHADSASTASIVVNAPAGLADNDIILALIKYGDTVTVNSPPSGWTSIGNINDSGTSGTDLELFWKLASSEGSSYTFGLSGATRVGVTVVAYRGGFDTADPIDVVGQGTYFTSDTTLRSPGATVTSANSSLIFLGGGHNGSTFSFTPPSSPATFTEDVDTYGSGDGRFGRTVANAVWTGSGATGNVDATMSITTSAKYAFLVALNPAASSSGLLLRRRR